MSLTMGNNPVDNAIARYVCSVQLNVDVIYGYHEKVEKFERQLLGLKNFENLQRL